MGQDLIHATPKHDVTTQQHRHRISITRGARRLIRLHRVDARWSTIAGQEALVPTGSGPKALRHDDPSRDTQGMTELVGNGDSGRSLARRLASLRGSMRLFDDRFDAGRQLAERLEPLRGKDIVVLGLPRGGLPVAFEVAKALEAPLDVLVVRKLGVPFQPELAFGAIGEDGVRVINDSVVAHANLSEDEMAAVEAEQRAELARRSERFRRGHDRVPIAARIAVIVDDGVATGATAKAACQVARAQGASRVVLAVPIGGRDIFAGFAGYADEVVCLHTPAFFFAVGQGYRDFTQTSDAEVIALLDRAREGFPEPAAAATPGDPPIRDEEVRVSAGPVSVAGHLTIPEHPVGVVVFAYGCDRKPLA